jgi:signal transduction histidine kinase
VLQLGWRAARLILKYNLPWTALREAERLNKMIGQLLTLSQVELGTDGLDDVKIDLPALVGEIVDNANFEARARDRSVRVIASEACTITGVVELLSSAIENVVRNAVRYTAVGTEVEVAVRRDELGKKKLAVVNVRDHGPGVRTEEISEIFRPFYRVETARDRKTGGTGLGLAISDRAVRLHGGSIRAANVPEGGLIIEIRLPLGES